MSYENIQQVLDKYLWQWGDVLIVVMDERLMIKDFNEAFYKFAGGDGWIVGENFEDYLEERDGEYLLGERESEFKKVKLRIKNKQGYEIAVKGYVALFCSGVVLIGEKAKAKESKVVAEMSEIHQELTDLSRKLAKRNRQLREANAKIEKMAITDGLTSLYNRRHFFELFGKMVSFSHRHGQPLSVIIADVDYFKKVNDQQGHQAGDKVLQLVGELLGNNCRKEDISGRYGGEEFVLGLANQGLNEAWEIGERIRREIEEKSNERFGFSVTLSLGVAELFENEGVDEVVKRADEKLYAAKESGRNQAVR